MSETRSSTCIVLGDCKYIEHITSLAYSDPVMMSPTRQAPTGVQVIGRINYLKRTGMSESKAFETVAEELGDIWLHGLNIYTLSKNSIIAKLKVLMNGRKKTNRYAAVHGFKTLRSWADKESPSFVSSLTEFNNAMMTGFDIRTYSTERIEELILLENESGLPLIVKMTDEEERLHADNIKVKTCTCSWTAPVKCSDCPRQMINDNDIDKRYKKWLERKLKDLVSEQNRETQAAADNENLKPVNTYEAIPEQDGLDDSKSPEDIPYLPSEKVHIPESNNMNKRNLRSSSRIDDSLSSSASENVKFPRIPIRHGYRNLDVKIMKTWIHCSATYKVSDNDLEGIFLDFANIVFGQEWEPSKTKGTDDSHSDKDDDDDDNENEEGGSAAKKRKRVRRDLTYVFPSRKTRRSWLRQGALLNLRYVAEAIREKGSQDVITLGFDDTTKAAGKQLFDVKTTHITIAGPRQSRQTFTTGYTPNISHSGKDQAENLQHSLSILAVLARESGNKVDEYTVNDICDALDFFMSDRSGDCDVLLDEMGIDPEKRLKCCGHTILGVDEAISSVLSEVESIIGQDKLIDKNISSGSFQSKGSIITRGLIALAKALSSSHISLSYTLYLQYKTWRQENDLELKEFLSFSSNRFGRLARLAETFVDQHEDLKTFFEEVIDENSNKLCQALASYISSDWFSTGCKVIVFFGKLFTIPLCEILGIDESKKAKNDERNWEGVKLFYTKKLSEIEKVAKDGQDGTNYDKLVGKCAAKVHETLTRQLSKMKFFSEEGINDDTLTKMKYAPLTNSGCESRFAQLDNRVKVSGGSTPISTISDKQIVASNKYLVSEKCQEADLSAQFKWAKTSEQAKLAMKMQDEFLAQVKVQKSLIIQTKKQIKQKKMERAINLGSLCREHGGPVKVENLDKLENLTDKQLLLEVQYLKATVASEIKMKKRVPDPENEKKYKYQYLPKEQLIQSIKLVVKPSGDVSGDTNIDALLAKVFEK